MRTVKVFKNQLREFYDRGRIFLDLVYQEAHLVPALAAWMTHWESARAEIVNEALRPDGADAVNTQMIAALTDYRVWRSLIDQNISMED